jgi:hypothetical protein
MNISDYLFSKALVGGGGGGATVEALTATSNGTYEASGVAYSPVTVNVPGSGMTLLYEHTYTVNTSVTTQKTIETLSLSATKNTWYYVTVEDTNGIQAGQFYGGNGLIAYFNLGGTGSAITMGTCVKIGSTGTNGTSGGYSGTSMYGVFVAINNSLKFYVASKYSSGQSGTINGDYRVRIYQLSSPVPTIPVFS